MKSSSLRRVSYKTDKRKRMDRTLLYDLYRTCTHGEYRVKRDSRRLFIIAFRFSREKWKKIAWVQTSDSLPSRDCNIFRPLLLQFHEYVIYVESLLLFIFWRQVDLTRITAIFEMKQFIHRRESFTFVSRSEILGSCDSRLNFSKYNEKSDLIV